MKFINVAAAALLTLGALAQDSGNGSCGSYLGCDVNKVPTQVLSGDLKLVAINDQQDPNVHYKLTGKVVIVNDCVFRVEGFTLTPQPKNPIHWGGKSKILYNGNILSKENVKATETPVDLEYNILSTDLYCKAALIDEVSRITLTEEGTNQLIGYADIAGSTAGSADGAQPSSGSSAPAASNPSSGSSAPAASNPSSGSSSTPSQSASTTTAAAAPTSNDANTSKWTMGLLALSSAVAYLIA